MAKPSLQSVMATKPASDAPAAAPQPALEQPAKQKKVERQVTSLRLPPEMMLELKFLAARKRARVNDLVIEAIKNYLVVQGRRAPAA